MSAVAEVIGWLVIASVGSVVILALVVLAAVIGVEAGDRIVERLFGRDRD